MSALDELLDQRAAEIARLGSLLEDAVAIIARWSRPDDAWLDAQGRAFLSDPTVSKIVERLVTSGWKGPRLICPACGSDYAEAEKKNERFSLVHPPGAGKTESLALGGTMAGRAQLDCCVKGQHSFSWRQGIEPCRYCGEPPTQW